MTTSSRQSKEMATALKFLECMLKYQQINNIKQQCMVNAQFLRNYFIEIRGSPVVKPTICVGIKNGCTVTIPAHLTILIDGILIDPSYEFQSIENKVYLHSIDEFVEFCKINEYDVTESPGFKYQMANFLRFVESAKRMNNGEQLPLTKYYNKLGKYVENIMRKWRNNPNNIDYSLTSKSIFDVM